MAHVVFPNTTPFSVNHAFSQIWALTRAMLKAGYTYLKSSDGSAIDSSGNPANDKWGAPVTTGNTGSTASFSSKTLDDITVTGLTGMTTLSVGRFLTITGCSTSANNGTWQIVSYVSATSVRIRNASGVAPDANNGAITWTEKDHALQTYSTVQATLDSAFAWILMQGPTTLKIPINANPSPAFTRGEKVTQATSGAEGEFMGIAWNTASDSFIIIQPRIGTFDGSNIVTGAVSSATFTPSGSPVSMVMEIVFAKSNDVYNGWNFCQRVNATTEAAQRFSALTPAAATAPGNGTAANAFPTIAYTVKGAPNSTAQLWFSNVNNVAASLMLGRAQIIVANAIGNTGSSPDGTFWMVQSMPGVSAETLTGFGFSRLDDQEDGEVDPYVWLVSNANTPTRILASPSGNHLWSNSTGFFSNSFFTHAGWRRRSYGGTGDMYTANIRSAWLVQASRGYVLAYNQGDPDRVACTNATVAHREALWAIDCETGERTRKGTHRWLFQVGSGNYLNLWDTRTWLQVVAANPGNNAGIIVGPWDGTTDPIYV